MLRWNKSYLLRNAWSCVTVFLINWDAFLWKCIPNEPVRKACGLFHKVYSNHLKPIIFTSALRLCGVHLVLKVSGRFEK